jgi:hypothetical protein
METSEDLVELELISVTGSIMRRELIHSTNEVATKQLDLTQLDSGVYFLRARNSIYSESKKVIVL